MFLRCIYNDCFGNKKLSLPEPQLSFTAPAPIEQSLVELEEVPKKTKKVAEGYFDISVTNEKGVIWKWDAAEYLNRTFLSRIETLQARSLQFIDDKKLIKGQRADSLKLPTLLETAYLREERLRKPDDFQNTLKASKNVKSSANAQSHTPSSQTSFTTPFIIQNISKQDFDSYFTKSKKEEVFLGASVFINTCPGLKIQDTACVCNNVGPNLAVGVISRDLRGIFKGSGLGFFSKQEVEEFCNNPNEESNFKYIISDAFARAPKVSIFIIGFYNCKYLKSLESAINSICRPEKFEMAINPWHLPENLLERPDGQYFEQYLFEQGCKLSVGITEKGEVFYANDGGQVLSIYEDRFAEWKRLRGYTKDAQKIAPKKNENPKPKNVEMPKLEAIQKEEVAKVTGSAIEGNISNLKKVLILQTAKDVYEDRENLTSRVDNYKNLENIKLVCDKRNFSIDDLLRVSEAKDQLFMSDRLRKILLFYAKKKYKQCLYEETGFYEGIVKDLLIYSVNKAIGYLSQPLQFSNQEINYAISSIFPGTVEEFLEISKVKTWLHTEAGKRVSVAIITNL